MKITKTILGGCTQYTNEKGEYHRDDGPAVEYTDGTKFWYQNGLRHRIDGPAVEYPSGLKFWYHYGQRISPKDPFLNSKSITFNNVSISIASDDKKIAYDKLCKVLTDAGFEFSTDTYIIAGEDEEHSTDKL